MKKLLIITSILAISGCDQDQKFFQQDIKESQAVENSVGDVNSAETGSTLDPNCASDLDILENRVSSLEEKVSIVAIDVASAKAAASAAARKSDDALAAANRAAQYAQETNKKLDLLFK